MEESRGSITLGKYTDLVLLSNNLSEIALEEMLNTKVILTLVGGEVVYSVPWTTVARPATSHSAPLR